MPSHSSSMDLLTLTQQKEAIVCPELWSLFVFPVYLKNWRSYLPFCHLTAAVAVDFLQNLKRNEVPE